MRVTGEASVGTLIRTSFDGTKETRFWAKRSPGGLRPMPRHPLGQAVSPERQGRDPPLRGDR
jgi:hypothetical protein